MEPKLHLKVCTFSKNVVSQFMKLNRACHALGLTSIFLVFLPLSLIHNPLSLTRSQSADCVSVHNPAWHQGLASIYKGLLNGTDSYHENHSKCGQRLLCVEKCMCMSAESTAHTLLAEWATRIQTAQCLVHVGVTHTQLSAVICPESLVAVVRVAIVRAATPG